MKKIVFVVVLLVMGSSFVYSAERDKKPIKATFMIGDIIEKLERENKKIDENAMRYEEEQIKQ